MEISSTFSQAVFKIICTSLTPRETSLVCILVYKTTCLSRNSWYNGISRVAQTLTAQNYPLVRHLKLASSSYLLAYAGFSLPNSTGCLWSQQVAEVKPCFVFHCPKYNLRERFFIEFTYFPYFLILTI